MNHNVLETSNNEPLQGCDEKKPNYSEILRYLGYGNNAADMETLKLIDDCVAEIKSLLGGRRCIFAYYDIKKEAGKVALQNTIMLLEGNDIAMHLASCDKAALMAVTLGVKVDQKLAYYSKFNLTRALVMDAVASSLVEDICDEVQEQIRKEAEEIGYNITDRYSPGYGDLSLQHQHCIIKTLDAEKQLGLTVTDSNLLIPRKSVTAIIGLLKMGDGDTKMTYKGIESNREKNDEIATEKSCSRNTNNKCRTCNMKDCRFRKGGGDNEQ